MADPDTQAKATARGRRGELLEAMRRSPDRWTTSRVVAFYEANGWGHTRHVARQDLQHLEGKGLLVEHGLEHDRSYSLNYAKEGNGHGWQTPVGTASPRKHRPDPRHR
ncbi:hypothetical protein OOK29_25780 [Streptomyces phaeochromogenes]|uniref:hypothetical protein n=1 Tax=Streptomyces phaeochromogenes TaxID=1923 RepID=UPI0022532117|nr:hypothetical protein [Streptomyces phaeochromogenes]MCX5601564.1 hypothetical protein [Streptomyces phaeochromogenes]